MKNLSPDDAPLGKMDELSALFLRAHADEAAAAQLYTRCRPLLAARLRRRFSAEVADDAAHDALAAAFAKRANYQPSRRFLPWLQTLATHLALDAIQRDTRRAERERVYAESEALVVAPHGPDPRRDLLVQSLAELPPPKRHLIERRYFAGESSEAIAAGQGRSRIAVAVEMNRICHTLRTRIEHAGRHRLALAA